MEISDGRKGNLRKEGKGMEREKMEENLYLIDRRKGNGKEGRKGKGK